MTEREVTMRDIETRAAMRAWFRRRSSQWPLAARQAYESWLRHTAAREGGEEPSDGD